MLKTMRNSFHQLKWTLFLVIAVFILGFVFWSGSSSDASRGSQIVARVGNERITAVEFDRQYRSQVERYRQMYQGNFSPELERALDLPRNVLDARNLQQLTFGSFPDPYVNQVGDEYLIYYTETGRAGGAYLKDTNGDGKEDWVPLHDPRVWQEGRSIRVGAGLSW